MTKKDFIVIAKAINTLLQTRFIESSDGLTADTTPTKTEAQVIVGIFSAELLKVNPRFDVEKFEKACYLK